ncbi:hypothetical protein CRYUN_Cryun13aG0015000 [Craigia yunnanensis]
MESPEKCAKAIVKSACRGDKYLMESSWVSSLYLLKVLCPDMVEYCNRMLFITTTLLTSNKTEASNNGLDKSSTSPDPKSE